MHKLIPKYYYFIDKLDIEEIKNLNNKIAVIYRNYQNKPTINEIKKFYGFCKKKQIKFLISNYFDIATKLNLDGFYIPSFNTNFYVQKNYHNKKFLIIGSAHNIKEIKIKEKQNVKLIFLSPIFKTKKKKNFLDIMRFNNLSQITKKPIIALGGINTINVKKLKMTNAFGFSGISHIKKIVN
jgi:thiamine-phosphate pyrophosphorylase